MYETTPSAAPGDDSTNDDRNGNRDGPKAANGGPVAPGSPDSTKQSGESVSPNPRAQDSPTASGFIHGGDRVRGRLPWRGELRTVEGVLDPDFLIADGRVLVRIRRLDPPLPGGDATEAWVEAGTVATTPEPTPPRQPALLLRSAMHELPADQTRDYALRTLSVTLSQFVAEGGTYMSLSPGGSGTVELSLEIAIPPSEGTDYLWRFRQATRPGRTKSALWMPPPAPFAEAVLASRSRIGAAEPGRGSLARSDVSNNPGRTVDRAHAAHYVGQLPLWLTTRRFWSVFVWRDGELLHLVQFTLPEKLRRTFVRRFRLEMI